MSQKKNYLYKVGRQHVADYFFLLGHCERMSVLETLVRFGPTSFKALHYDSPLSKSTLSQHLMFLRSANLIDVCAIGKGSGYKVNEEKFLLALHKLQSYLDLLENDDQRGKAA